MDLGSQKSASSRKKWGCAKNIGASGHQWGPTCTQASALQLGPHNGEQKSRCFVPPPGEVMPQGSCRLHTVLLG